MQSLITSGTLYILFICLCFLYWGGVFFKSGDIKESFKKDCKRLLLPYLFAALICLIQLTITSVYTNDFNVYKLELLSILFDIENLTINGYRIHASGMLWFLYSLFFLRLGANILTKYLPQKKKTIFFLCAGIILFTYLASFLYQKGLRLPFSILQAVCASSYFAFGYLAKGHIYRLTRNNLFCAICLIVWMLSALYSRTEIAFCMFDMPILAVFGSICAFFILYKVAEFLLSQTTEVCRYVTRLLSLSGEYSMFIFIAHYISLIHRTTIANPLLNIPLNIILSILITIFFIKIPFINNILSGKGIK